MELSVLMPFYNEEKQIPITIERMIPLLDELKMKYELILIDDGSVDQTWARIEDAKSAFPNKIRGLRLSRNFGKEAAICAGLDFADGHAVILMDGDLQHPPEYIPEMLRLWRDEGYDVVEGVKEDRGKESFFSKLNARIFYSLFRKVAGYDLSNASDFKLLDRKVVIKWRSLKEHNTFFRGLSAWLGFNRAKMPFEVAPRETGASRWGLRALIKLSINAITSFSAIPLHLITVIGICFLIGAIIMIIQTLFNYFSGYAASGFTTVIISVLAIGACIMISLGLIGSYIAQIFEEVKNRPRYIIDRDTSSKDEAGRSALSSANKEAQ